MKSLSDYLNSDSTIHAVPYEKFEENITHVFCNDKYKFYLNSELIDVNNRFRIFKYNHKFYIVKKTNLLDGKLEVHLAEEAKKALDETKVDKYTIKIVNPTLYHIGSNAYILTEYLGKSLQEYNYFKSKEKFPLDSSALFKILQTFRNKGILYRGFLPRNTIIKNNTIFLLDWEDAIFNSQMSSKMNLLWKTNFLLNWSYFYDEEQLNEYLENNYIIENSEPELLKYEKTFEQLTRLKCDKIELRKIILNTILLSEKKIADNSEEFIIPPNDVAHLISDLFNTDIDVLFDIACYNIRKINEKEYINILKKLSKTIPKLCFNNINIQRNTVLILLELFEKTANQDNCSTPMIINLFKYNKIEFYTELRQILNKIMNQYSNCDIEEKDYLRIFKYIYSFK